MEVEKQMRRCTDCPEHSGVTAQLMAGKGFMDRLEKRLDDISRDFTNHVNSSAKSTIAMLIGILMCFLTGVVGIYTNHVSDNNKNNKQAQIEMLVKQTLNVIEKSKSKR